jgi:3-methyl-2-oxobutanoate hydroxymethyltransferase
MSPSSPVPISLPTLLRRKGAHPPVSALTAYDYPTARLLDEAGVEVVLVGDSLGMMVLGHPDTTLVTMEEMLHHTRAVVRGTQRAFVMADLPFGSVLTPSLAVDNARRLRDAGAHAVKLEGGASHADQIAAIVAHGIPVMAHIGMQPQRVKEEGGYRIKGRTEPERDALFTDAQVVHDAGAWGLLLELVTPAVAGAITAASPLLTIGIGSGPDCDGQVLVVHDLVGGFPWFRPKFAPCHGDVAGEICRAVHQFIASLSAND